MIIFDREILEEAYSTLKSILTGVEKSPDKIKESAFSLKHLPKYKDLSEKQFNELISMYETREGVLAPEPIVIIPSDTDNHWLYEKKQKINHNFFNRYKKYLMDDDGFNENMVNQIEVDSERILSYCSNPELISNNSYVRKKGLVVGDVQSGKTASYLGLISTACDYGYKVIVLLSGLTDNLRIQTQRRVDKAIVGAKSNTIGSIKPEYIGVGKNTKLIYSIPLTNVESDFGKVTQNMMNFNISDLSKPIILVVKKNKSVLNSLKDWLKPGQNQIEDKILIIDDEADNASLNVKKPNPENEPSVINGLIRDLFNNFKVASYVGYTATPFSNIFIDPNDDETYKDLFPSDFIIQLIASEQYFGANKVFSLVDQSIPRPIRILDPNEIDFLSESHNNNVGVYLIPHSLKEAIMSFLINNAIRTLRGDNHKHRSMMINISRFNNVQSIIHFQVKDFVENFRIKFEQTHYQDTKYFEKDQDLRLLQNVYLSSSFYRDLSKQFSWNDVKSTINNELKMIRVELMNSKLTGENRFDYDSIEEGARVIIIGGFVLSRGLTLEGLNVSYFSRPANAYDTMLQMCRWFGYRPNYEDLCRVYITNENLENFRAVLDAVNDLKGQFLEMQLNHKNPDEFGLMIKRSPDTLETNMLITARQKMRQGKEILRYLSYGGVSVDTSKLYYSNDIVDLNINKTQEFLSMIQSNVIMESGEVYYENVSSFLVADYLESIKLPFENKRFAKDSLVQYLKETDLFTQWRVVVANGEGRKSDLLSELGYSNSVRKFDYKLGENFVRISGNKNRILDPGILKTGLTQEQINEVKKITLDRVERSQKRGITRSETSTASDYLSIRDIKPILVVYPIQLKKPFDPKTTEEEAFIDKSVLENFYSTNKDKIFIGVALGFPNKEDKKLVTYIANLRKIEEMQFDENLEDE